MTNIKRLRFGISFRITAISVASVLIATIFISLVSILLIKSILQSKLQAEQWARVESIAQGIDEKFSSRRITLRILAESIPKSSYVSSSSLQGFLTSLPSLKSAFDNVSILDLSGNLVANLNGSAAIGKVNVSDRDYFRQTLATRTGVISKPFRNRYSGIAQVSLTQPVIGPDGQLAYVISAAINLHEDNFLGEFSDVKFGRTGYLFIINSDGTVIDHPDKTRIFTLANGAGHNNAPVQKALSGFEGSMEATSSYGVPGLYVYKRIQSTDWILGAIYPTAEAFESINDLQRRAVLYGLILALAAGLITATAMLRQLRPLASLHQSMSTDAITPLQEIPLAKFKNDELGDIAKAYNASRQATYTFSVQLHKSEQHLRDILTHAGDAFVAINADGAITEWNRQAEETFGWTRDEVMGQHLEHILIPEESRQAHVDGMKRFVVSGTGPAINKRIELMALHRDGHRIATELSIAASFDGINYIASAFIRDITARKFAERKLIENEKFLRTITDNLPILIGYVDINERYQFANASYQKFLGVDPIAVIGKSMRDVLGEMSYAEVAPYITTVKQGSSAHFERAVEINGKSFHFMGDYIPDIGDNGVVNGFFILVLDITARKNAEIGQAISEQRLKSITDNLPSMIAQIDRQERYVFVNEFVTRTFGTPPAVMLGKTMREVRGEDVYARIGPFVQQALKGETGSFEGIATGIDRGEFYYQADYLPSFNQDGENDGFYVMTFDITQRKKAEMLQAESEQRLRLITDNLPVLISYMDKNRRLQFGNATFKQWLDVDPLSMVGKLLKEVIGEKRYLDRLEYLDRAFAGETVRFVIASEFNGVERQLQTVYVPHETTDGTVMGVYTLTSDVTAQKKIENQLFQLARVDSLTGLPNRRQFEERLDEALARVARNGKLLALMFLDIDHFKAINDQLGHAAGDAVLLQFGEALRDSVRKVDVVARLAGDEFVVVLEGLNDTSEASTVAEKMLKAVVRSIPSKKGLLKISTSIGIAFANNASDAPQLLEHADQALYLAKKRGRNQFAVWPDDLSSLNSV
ncbi:PAS domain S-box protein [Undibacterium sp. Di27W]|uniref:PAS domain S-box protein n=1 Tax=Undibacterium sp. Di27W TaxID=3413036 RepID=UPI003BF093AA